MSERLTVHRDGKAIYDIVIESSFDHLGEELKALDVNGKKLCIVTDSTVAPLYLEQVRGQLLPQCGQVDAFCLLYTSPKIPVPTLIMVAPSSIATS